MEIQTIIPKTFFEGINSLGKKVYYLEINKKMHFLDNCSHSVSFVKEIPNENLSGLEISKSNFNYYQDWYSTLYLLFNGVEIAISAKNLAYIQYKHKLLNKCKFVFGYYNKRIVVIPENYNSLDTMKIYSEIYNKKIKKSELVIGGIYLNQFCEKVIYLGKRDYYTYPTSTPIKCDIIYRLPYTKKIFGREEKVSGYIDKLYNSPYSYFKKFTGNVDPEIDIKLILMSNMTNFVDPRRDFIQIHSLSNITSCYCKRKGSDSYSTLYKIGEFYSDGYYYNSEKFTESGFLKNFDVFYYDKRTVDRVFEH